jgi:hypothetical protein
MLFLDESFNFLHLIYDFKFNFLCHFLFKIIITFMYSIACESSIFIIMIVCRLLGLYFLCSSYLHILFLFFQFVLNLYQYLEVIFILFISIQRKLFLLYHYLHFINPVVNLNHYYFNSFSMLNLCLRFVIYFFQAILIIVFIIFSFLYY